MLCLSAKKARILIARLTTLSGSFHLKNRKLPMIKPLSLPLLEIVEDAKSIIIELR